MKKNLITYFILIVLIISNVILVLKVANITQKYDEIKLSSSYVSNNIQENTSSINYDSDIANIENQLEQFDMAISDLKNDSTKTSDEINTFKTDLKQFNSKLDELNENISEYNNENLSLPDYSDSIYALEEKIKQLENNDTSVNNELLKKWKTSVDYFEYSSDSHQRYDVTYITTYEFKPNGDFYINDNKVGIYKDTCIFFKDSNDEQYRVTNYYYINNSLYLNLFSTNKDIIVGGGLYKCEIF